MSATLPTQLQGANSFGGTRFWYVQQQGTAAPRIPREALAEVREAPWGNRTVVQISGLKSAQLSLTILVRREDLAALYGKVGTSGTLSLVGDSNRNAILLSLTGEWEYQEGFSQLSASFLVRP